MILNEDIRIRICKKCHMIHFTWQHMATHLKMCVGLPTYDISDFTTLVWYPKTTDRARFTHEDM